MLKVEIPATPTNDFAAVSWERAREMDAGDVQIESHTVTHPILANQSSVNVKPLTGTMNRSVSAMATDEPHAPHHKRLPEVEASNSPHSASSRAIAASTTPAGRPWRTWHRLEPSAMA